MNLEARIEKLELENRFIKRFAITAVTITVLAGVTMGAAWKNYTAFDWVSAYGFTIRDSAARDRGGIAYDPKLGPYFYLKDNDGQTKVRITLEGRSRQ
jgi:hypothetical protein